MKEEKIGKFEGICLMLIIIMNAIVLNIPNLIILSTGTSAIINIIYVSLIAIFVTKLFVKLFNRFPGKDILDISQYVGGNILKTILGIAFLIFFIFISTIAIRYLAGSMKIIYFNNSPYIYILLFFIIPAIVLNKVGIKAISGVNVIFIFVILISLFLLLFFSYKNFSFEKLFPILGNGFSKTFIKGATNIFAFTNLIFLFFLPSLLKKTDDFKKIAMSSIIISAIIFIFNIATMILTLPIATESDEMLTIYLLARMVGFGNFLERLDALFIFAWILTLLSSLSVTLFYIIRIFKKIFNLKDEKVLASPLGLIVLGNALLLDNYAQIKFLGNYVYRYVFIVLVFVVCLTVLLIASVKDKKSKTSVK